MLKIKGLKSKVATQSDNRGSEEKAESLGKAHERKPGSKVHICSRCNFPIAIYGQLLPCKHAFCLQCAYEMGPTCYLCFEKVDEIKKIEACKQALYMCGVCLKSYESMTDLMARVKQNGGGCCQAQPRDKQDNTQAPVGMDVSIV